MSGEMVGALATVLAALITGSAAIVVGRARKRHDREEYRQKRMQAVGALVDRLAELEVASRAGRITATDLVEQGRRMREFHILNAAWLKSDEVAWSSVYLKELTSITRRLDAARTEEGARRAERQAEAAARKEVRRRRTLNSPADAPSGPPIFDERDNRDDWFEDTRVRPAHDDHIGEIARGWDRARGAYSDLAGRYADLTRGRR